MGTHVTVKLCLLGFMRRTMKKAVEGLQQENNEKDERGESEEEKNMR
jgi:hypothetical protein